MSQPLASKSVDLDVTPPGVGTHYIWASAKSQCASSSAEFRIDVVSPRRQAVRR
jgi:hypothetical protein